MTRRWLAITSITLVVTNATWLAAWNTREVWHYGDTIPKVGRCWTVILRHIDGDTVQLGTIIDEGTARLLDIDTPELEPRLGLSAEEKKNPLKLAVRRAEIDAEKEAARAAAKRLAELLPIHSVWRTEVEGRDGFRRPLVRFIREDGHSINRQMIVEGHAQEYRP